jgi:hypothetical protein
MRVSSEGGERQHASYAAFPRWRHIEIVEDRPSNGGDDVGATMMARAVKRSSSLVTKQEERYHYTHRKGRFKRSGAMA